MLLFSLGELIDDDIKTTINITRDETEISKQKDLE